MDYSLEDLMKLIQTQQITPTQSIDACFERIHLLNPTLNAFVYLVESQAKELAAIQTQRLKNGESLPPLTGIPFGVKDLEDCKGLPTSYGTTVYKNNIALTDSPQVARLKAAGGILVGKTNTPIFGSLMYSSKVI